MNGQLNPLRALQPSVYIIDCDSRLVSVLIANLRSNQFSTKSFDCAESFLRATGKANIACMIIENNLPGMSGVELLEELNRQGFRVPTILLSSTSDIKTAVRAMQARAVDFFEKPVLASTLVSKVLSIFETN